MGLCKCPKKKVTNLFCFEHRVNVCEYCLVESHSKCVVQSYLSWLTDSDYDTNCSLCSSPLADRETVRLQCLHLFHWDCLDVWARRLPPNTAPAGYRCQLCREAIFPGPNQTSPTIEQLKAKLQLANWARVGLGLSLLPELENVSSSVSFVPGPAYMQHHNVGAGQQPVIHASDSASSVARSNTPATVLDVDGSYSQHDQTHFTARKPTGFNEGESEDYSSTNPLISRGRNRDEDLPENKYKRRSAGEWLARWLRTRYGGRSNLDPRSGCKRKFFVLLIAILVIMTVFTVLTRVLSVPSDDDPAFDPLANPNVHVAAVHQQENN